MLLLLVLVSCADCSQGLMHKRLANVDVMCTYNASHKNVPPPVFLEQLLCFFVSVKTVINTLQILVKKFIDKNGKS